MGFDMKYYFFLGGDDRNVSLWARHKEKERVIYEYPECKGDYSEYFSEWRTIDAKNGDLILPELVKVGVAVPISKKEAEEWLFLQNI